MYEEGARYKEHEKDEIAGLLLGRRVAKVRGDALVLDDGTALKVVPNIGGCSCSAGDYALTELNGTDNVITKVEFDYAPTGDMWDEYRDGRLVSGERPGHYRIFVYAGHRRINLLTVEGDDGNGYYGTGFELVVRAGEGRR